MVNSRGIKAGLDPAQILLALRSGLRDEIKSTIMQHPEIRSVADIIKWGTISERYPPSTSNLTRELVEAIKRIDDTMHKSNLRPIIQTKEEETPNNSNHTGYQQNGNVAFGGSGGRFDNENTAFGESDGRFNNQIMYNRSFTSNGGERRGGYNNERQGGYQGGYQGSDQGGYQQDYRPNGPQRDYNSGPYRGNASGAGNYRPPGRFSGNNYNTGRGDSGSEICQFCGFPRHDRAICPARNAECGKCRKPGHWARVCRSTAGPQNVQH